MLETQVDQSEDPWRKGMETHFKYSCLVNLVTQATQQGRKVRHDWVCHQRTPQFSLIQSKASLLTDHYKNARYLVVPFLLNQNWSQRNAQTNPHS